MSGVRPNKIGAEAFVVIRDAMADQARVALAKIVLAHREHVIAVESLGKGMVGTTLRYDYEVRDEKDVFDDVPPVHVSKDEARGAHPGDQGNEVRPTQLQGRV